MHAIILQLRRNAVYKINFHLNENIGSLNLQDSNFARQDTFPSHLKRETFALK